MKFEYKLNEGTFQETLLKKVTQIRCNRKKKNSYPPTKKEVRGPTMKKQSRRRSQCFSPRLILHYDRDFICPLGYFFFARAQNLSGAPLNHHRVFLTHSRDAVERVIDPRDYSDSPTFFSFIVATADFAGPLPAPLFFFLFFLLALYFSPYFARSCDFREDFWK